MAKYVVFKAHTFEPENEVYFQYHLEEALTFLRYKEAQTGEEWEIAEIFPTESKWFRLLEWLYSKVGS